MRARRTVRLWEGKVAQLDHAVAYVFLALMFIKVPGVTLVPIGAFFLLPFILLFGPTMIRTRPACRVAIAALVAVLTGLIMRFASMSFGLPGSDLPNLGLILAWVLAFPVLLIGATWAFERVDIVRGFAVMFLFATVSAYRLDQDWKGSFGITTTLFLLAFFARRSLFWTRLTLLGAVALDGMASARTPAAVAFIVFLCTFLTRRQAAWIGRHPKRSVVLILGAFVGLSFVMVNVMLSGLLGGNIQARTLEQTSNGRDLLTSGRAEWAATLNLFSHSPLGFGVGVTPDGGMQSDAITAVHAAGGDYLTTYWITNVFPERVDLHSSVANLWSHFSLGGVLLAATIGLTLLGAIPLGLSAIRSLGAMPLFAILNSLWDLMFSPMADADRLLMGLIAAVVLTRVRASGLWPLSEVNPGREPTPRKATRSYTSRSAAIRSARSPDAGLGPSGAN